MLENRRRPGCAHSGEVALALGCKIGSNLPKEMRRPPKYSSIAIVTGQASVARFTLRK